MSKYFKVIKLTWEEYLVNRWNVVMINFRSFVLFLTLILFWLAIFKDRQNLFNYELAQILTYIIGVTFLRGLVIASRSTDLEADIYSSKLNNTLLLPFSLIRFYFARDIADKITNLIFVLIEIAIVILVFKPPFYFPSQVSSYLFFAVAIVLASLLFFFLNLIASALAFWTGAVWAPRWLLMIILLEFLSGAIFPIDVLPSWLAQIFLWTPFPYLLYFPMKIWLEQITMNSLFIGFVTLGIWFGVSLFFSKYIWSKGLKNFTASGG